MKDWNAMSACEDYEFDVAELVDDTLAPEKARVVSLHLAGCARCRRWRHEYSAMDARLAHALQAPRLPADFEWTLANRVRARTQVERADTRAAAEREYSQVVDRLRRGLRAATLGGVASAVAAAGCALAVLPTLIERARPMASALQPQSATVVVGLIASAIAAAALAWSFGNGVLPGLRLRR